MKFLKKKNINIGFITIGIAIIVSMIPILELWHTHSIYSGADMQFHINRIYEIAHHIKNGNLSLISTESFNSVGSGVQYFYPQLTLIPIALIFLVIKNSVTAYYISLFIYGLITFVIGEFAFSKLIKNTWIATLGTIIFSLSTYRVFSVISVSAFGEFIAIAWLPLVLLGYYRVINREGWRTLWLSLVLIGYTHLLSLLLVVIVLFVITLIRFVVDYKQVFYEIPYYVKVGIGFLISFLAFLIPFVCLMKQNIILSPDAVLHYQWAQSFAGYFVSSAQALFTRTLGCSFVILLISFFFVWYKLTKHTRIIFWSGLCITFIASSDFPWYKLENTIVATLQFPYRFLPMAILLLTFSGLLAMKDMEGLTKNKNITKYIVVFLSLIVMITTAVNIHNYKKQANETYKTASLGSKHLNYTPFAQYRVTKLTFNKQMNNYFDTYGAFDYWTQKSLQSKKTIMAHQVVDDNKNTVLSIMRTRGNSITYVVNNPENQKLDLPFLKYNGVSYQVKINDHYVPYAESKRGTLLVDANKGKLMIEVTPQANPMIIITLIISLIGTASIIFLPKKIKHKL